MTPAVPPRLLYKMRSGIAVTDDLLKKRAQKYHHNIIRPNGSGHAHRVVKKIEPGMFYGNLAVDGPVKKFAGEKSSVIAPVLHPLGPHPRGAGKRAFDIFGTSVLLTALKKNQTLKDHFGITVPRVFGQCRRPAGKPDPACKCPDTGKGVSRRVVSACFSFSNGNIPWYKHPSLYRGLY